MLVLEKSGNAKTMYSTIVSLSRHPSPQSFNFMTKDCMLIVLVRQVLYRTRKRIGGFSVAPSEDQADYEPRTKKKIKNIKNKNHLPQRTYITMDISSNRGLIQNCACDKA
jgi:hypothetical protein